MTEQTPETPDLENEVVPADFDDAFGDWIGGAALTKRSVTIYGRPDLAAEFQSLEREKAVLEESSELTDTMAGDPRLHEIEQAMGELYDQWQASKSEWIVQDISAQIDQVNEAVGDAPVAPEAPEEPKLRKGASDVQKRAHTVAMQKYDQAKAEHEAAVREYEKAASKWSEEYALQFLAHAVVEVRFPDGRVSDGVSVEQLRAMRAKLGERQLRRLQDEARQAMTTEPVISAPFSPSDSQPIQE
ncbi:hypothetical protein [Aeromicrobium piscarium]|uniref:Uncharacterized protein n=1 Tax=Aeromicrobium piscarium TaxID=2590901 RepID=A0A554SP59_9ACTN|nr:hypothetical protein [Aeromicrobium piscarium]TSD68134.1 hypothetical protein FNM00_00620 [Aeromicrobium piscarium]